MYLYKFFGVPPLPPTFIILKYSSIVGRFIIYLQTTSCMKAKADSSILKPPTLLNYHLLNYSRVPGPTWVWNVKSSKGQAVIKT